MVPTPQATTYRALCRDPAKNPLGVATHEARLRDIYESFSAGGANDLTPNELCESILLDMDRGMIGGLLMFRETDPANQPGGEAVVLHNLKKHGDRGSALWGEIFAYVGDVVGQDIEMVHFDTPDQFFTVTDPIRVSGDVATHQALLDASPNAAVLDPLADTVANSRVVESRYCMFLPYSLMPKVLASPPLTARQAFEQVSVDTWHKVLGELRSSNLLKYTAYCFEVK